MNFWWVAQGNSFQRALSEKFLMAPISPPDRKIFHWDNVALIKRGDVIFNYFDKYIRGVSIAKNDAYKTKYIPREGMEDKHSEGWRVDINIVELNSMISIDKIGPSIGHLKHTHSPVNPLGQANQGYLFKLLDDAVEIIVNQINFQDLSEELQKKLKIKRSEKDFVNSIINNFNIFLKTNSFLFNPILIKNLISSTVTKPFLIVTGNSGTGKTKLAQLFAQWLVKNNYQTCSGWCRLDR